jgi:hypothetical protein
LSSKGEGYWFDNPLIGNGFALFALVEKIFLLAGHLPPPLVALRKNPPKMVRMPPCPPVISRE